MSTIGSSSIWGTREVVSLPGIAGRFAGTNWAPLPSGMFQMLEEAKGCCSGSRPPGGVVGVVGGAVVVVVVVVVGRGLAGWPAAPGSAPALGADVIDTIASATVATTDIAARQCAR
ncbi:hypothetical protein GCM10023200_36540 [Actinomycetospora chlora]|uniref:Uncharacterized protein n=1 Tax=Actinomycetospora chlora TaxID=663608 RepID=A0ABP9BPB9_9PSEU